MGSRRLLHLDAQVAVVLQGRHQQHACVPITPELVHEHRGHEVQEDLEDEHDVEVISRTPRASRVAAMRDIVVGTVIS